MTNQAFEELAKLYGIKINIVECGKGGLFHVDSNGQKADLENLFSTSDYTIPKHEIMPFQNCNFYSTYTDLDSLMVEAA